jgi:hypothetical protein
MGGVEAGYERVSSSEKLECGRPVGAKRDAGPLSGIGRMESAAV